MSKPFKDKTMVELAADSERRREPVAWAYDYATTGNRFDGYSGWKPAVSIGKPDDLLIRRNIRPLFEKVL